MNRRHWLRILATAGTTGLTFLAGCSGITGDNGNADDDGETGASDSGDETGGRSEDETSASAGTGGRSENETDDGATTPELSADGATASDQALDTGQAPPSDTGTPFENTNTVPENEGLETGQAPNATNASDGE